MGRPKRGRFSLKSTGRTPSLPHGAPATAGRKRASDQGRIRQPRANSTGLIYQLGRMGRKRRQVGLDDPTRWVFNHMADVYDARPAYPAALLEALVALAY